MSSQFNQRSLGKSSIKITPIGLGAWQFSEGKNFNNLIWKSIDSETTNEIISQAVKAGNLMFISGQIPLDPESGDLVSQSIEDQAKQVLENVKSICEAAGSSLDDIVKISIFLSLKFKLF